MTLPPPHEKIEEKIADDYVNNVLKTLRKINEDT
jgi:hypothetical protein